MLERLPVAPHLVVHFVGCSGETLASDEAQLDNEMVPRLANESRGDFEKRLLSMASCGRPALIVMFPSASEVERDEERALHKARASGIPEIPNNLMMAFPRQSHHGTWPEPLGETYLRKHRVRVSPSIDQTQNDSADDRAETAQPRQVAPAQRLYTHVSAKLRV
jgi:hypothetical protein